MTWFNGKLIGSYLGGARFKFLLAPFYTNLFVLLLFIYLLRHVATKPCAHAHPNRIVHPIESWTTRNPTKPQPGRVSRQCSSAQPDRAMHVANKSKIKSSESSTFV